MYKIVFFALIFLIGAVFGASISFKMNKENSIVNQQELRKIENKEDECYLKTFELKEEISNIKSLCNTKIKEIYRLLILVNNINIYNENEEELRSQVSELILSMSSIELLLDIREEYKNKINKEINSNHFNITKIINDLYEINQIENNIKINHLFFTFFKKNSKNSMLIFNSIEVLKNKNTSNIYIALENLQNYKTQNQEVRNKIEKIKKNIQLFTEIENLKIAIINKIKEEI